MTKAINRHGLKLFFASFGILLAVFALICTAGFFGLAQINQGQVSDSRNKQAILETLRDLRLNFTAENNAITYGISKSMNQSQAIFQEAEKKIQKDFNKLRESLKNDKGNLALVNTLISRQTLLSDQITKLFKSIRYSSRQSLTYDELVDQKSYKVELLNEANAYATTMDNTLGQLETAIAEEYDRTLSSIISSLENMKLFFLVLAGALFILTAILSFIFAHRATEPMTTTSGIIREMVRSNYNTQIDYSSLNNSDTREILRTFSTAVSTFKTFIRRAAEALEELAASRTGMAGDIGDLRHMEESKRSLITDTAKSLLAYGQDLENTGFYLNRIRDRISGLSCARDTALRSLSGMAEKSSHIMDAHSRLMANVHKFSETATRINMLASNAGSEAARNSGDPNGIKTITSEIRRLVNDAIESNRVFSRIINENRSSVSLLRDGLQSATRELLLMDGHFKEIETESSQLGRITGSGETVRERMSGNDRKLSALMDRTGRILESFENADKRLEEGLRSLTDECFKNMDLKHQVNYTKIPDAESFAEQAVFGVADTTDTGNRTPGVT